MTTLHLITAPTLLLGWAWNQFCFLITMRSRGLMVRGRKFISSWLPGHWVMRGGARLGCSLGSQTIFILWLGPEHEGDFSASADSSSGLLRYYNLCQELRESEISSLSAERSPVPRPHRILRCERMDYRSGFTGADQKKYPTFHLSISWNSICNTKLNCTQALVQTSFRYYLIPNS